MEHEQPSPSMPDHYDRLLGALDGLPGVLSTKPSTVQQITPILGTSQTFIVRTVRQQERTLDSKKESAAPAEFMVFLEHASRERGLIRIVLPPRVTDLISRQRDALTTQARKKTARRVAQERKDQGIESPLQRPDVRAKAMKGLAKARAARKKKAQK
jgi:hypothetical protein